jgi:hypothetical protein
MVNSPSRRLPGAASPGPPLARETSVTTQIEPVALRSFDRQYVIYDARVLDMPRPPLWQVRGSSQIYVTEQHARAIETGPGLTFAALVPSVHHFNGRGGRVLPLYRDADARAPNLAPGLADLVGRRLGADVPADDMLAYIAATVAHSGYTARFRGELRTPGVRVPLTADRDAWREAVTLGRTVPWLHTYGERYYDPERGRPYGPPRLPRPRQPRVIVTIPDLPDRRPAEMSYDR